MNLQLQKLLACTLLVSTVKSCPSFCICKWQDDVQTVECPLKNLGNIPENIDSATQVLDLSGNNFQQHKDFKKFANLQKLFLKNCQISSLESAVFEGLTNLADLDLSENLLNKVPLEALIKCPSLTKLNLSKNPIKTLEKLAFNHLNFLQNIDLSSCELTQIHPDAFNNLNSLEWLDLSQNKLNNLPQLPMPKSLKGVQLHGNQWVCDCEIKPLSAWLKIYPVLVAPICDEPRKFRGLPVRGLNDSELSCEPQIEYFEVAEGQNVTLICGISEAEVNWQFNNKTISLNQDLVLSGLKHEDSGNYYCLAKDIVIRNFSVFVLKPRNATKLLQDESRTLQVEYFEVEEEEGQKVTLICKSEAEITWQFKNKTISSNPDLVLSGLQIEDGGNYYCLAKDIVIRNFTVIVLPRPRNATKLIQEEEKSSLIPILMAAGLIVGSLCFVALLMTLLKRHGQAKNVKPEVEIRNIQRDFIGTSEILAFDIVKVKPQIRRQRTHAYLNPTLRSNFRPVSAPSFERYVENYDLNS